MKRILFVIIAAAVAAIACNKETPEISIVDESEISVYASLPQTKLAVDAGKVTWTTGDIIAVYNAEGTKFELTLSEGAGTNYGKFSGSFSGALATDLAVYPAAYAGETKGEVVIPWCEPRMDNVPAVMASALSVDGANVEATLFHHVMAIVEITIKDIPAYARGLKLFSKTGAQMSGTYTINDGLNGVECPVGSSDGHTNSHLYHFPYKTAYGDQNGLKFCFPVPAYDYTDLKIRVIDGDEDVIEGTDLTVKAENARLKAGDYLTMPAINVRAQVGTARDNFVKVEKTKWAKANLRAWKSGASGEGWQPGWNIYDNSWESQYMLLNDEITGESVNFSLNTAAYKEDAVYTHWDYFSWGTIGRASRVHNQPFISTVVNFEIVGKVFSAPREGSAAVDISQCQELEGDARFEENAFDAENPQIGGDLAFWASKGQYRMPKRTEVGNLYAKNYVGVDDAHAHMQAGYVMVGNKKVNGILFTSCPSWETTTYVTDAVELDEADLESGLFLPKCGERTRNNSPATYNATNIMYFNSWGAYWSGTYGGLNEGFTDCAVHIFFTGSNAMNYGYTSSPSKTISGQTILGNCIRPVWIPEGERN